MNFGSDDKPPTQTTEQVLSPEQREILNLAMPGLKEFAASPPKYYGGSTVAGADPLQTQGQEQVLAATGKQGDVVGSAAGANQFLTSGDVLNTASNPGLQSHIDAAVRPIYNNLTERVLPAVRSGANQAGQFGGSRQAIAEGLASRDAAVAAGDTSAKIASQAYGQGLDAFTKGIGLSGGTAQNLSIPGQATSAVGDVRRSLASEVLGSDVDRWNYEQMLPLLTGKELASLSGSIPGGSTVSTGSLKQQNPLLQSLGGAATGASLGSMFGPVGTAGGAGIGALLPFLMRA